LLGGGGIATITSTNNDYRCGITVTDRPNREDVDSHQITFRYSSQNTGLYQIRLHPGVTVVPTSGYNIDNDFLTKDGNLNLALEDINNAELIYQNFRFKLNLEGLNSGNGECAYYVSRGSNAQPADGRLLSANLELLQPGSDGSCYTTTTRLQSTSLGKVIHSQNIKIQESSVQVALASEMHEEFMAGSYNTVMGMANAVIQRRVADLNEAVAIYYWTASLVMSSGAADQIRSLIGLFYRRQFGRDSVVDPYPADVISSGEYQRIARYLCEVDSQYGGTHSEFCVGTSTTGSTTTSQTLCGASSGTRTGFTIPNWDTYTCQEPAGGTTCLPYTQYVPDGVTGRGCPGSQLCCSQR
jgi:hypothetical protein